MPWDFTNIIRAREVLDPFWKKALLRGRCWGVKSIENNPFAATNINLASEDETISVCTTKEGAIIIHHFIRAKETNLGKEVKEALMQAGLPVRDW